MSLIDWILLGLCVRTQERHHQYQVVIDVYLPDQKLHHVQSVLGVFLLYLIQLWHVVSLPEDESGQGRRRH